MVVAVPNGAVFEHELARERRIAVQGHQSGPIEILVAERANRGRGRGAVAPEQYLALWRMQLASRLLAEGRQVAEAADEVGYESEAAFSRAFKKLVGQAPATWRKQAAAGSVVRS